MSFHGKIEDKSGKPELPRSLNALIGLMADLEQAIARQNRSAIEVLLPDFEQARKRANHDQIFVYSPRGQTSMPILEAYAEALNRAISLQGQALGLVGDLGGRY